MDIELRRDTLARVLRAVARVAKPLDKSVAGALLDVGKSLTISATDGATTVVATVPGEVKATGVCAIDPGRLGKAVATLGEAVRLKLKADSLTVSSGGHRFELPIMPVDALPRLTVPDAKPFLVGDAKELAAWLGNAAYCAGQDEDRPATLGVMVESDGGKLTAVATDGHRAAWSIRDGAACERWRVDGGALLGALEAADGVAELSRTPERLVVAVGPFRYALPMYAADQFPPWRQVVPTAKHRFRCNREALVAAVRAASVVGDDKTAAAELTITASELAIAATGTGEAALTVPGDWDGKKAVTVTLSVGYLLAALEHVTGDTVALGYAEDLAPFMVGDHALIMPRVL